VTTRARPYNRRPRALVLAIAASAVAVLAWPGAASAHSGSLVNALDYRAAITSKGRGHGLFTAKVLDGDRRLELEVASTATLVVLGYQGEQFLRFSPSGVEVNERSTSAIANRLAKRGAVPALDPHATPDWSRASAGHAYSWHDHRLGPIPGRRYPEGDLATWRIPYVVSGHPSAVTGRLLHAQGPPLWPWLVALAATLAGALAVAARRDRRDLVERVLFASGTIAGAAAVLLSVSFGFTPGRSVSNA